MPGGTWASYQGFPCVAVVFRRARGTAASRSEVVIDLGDLERVRAGLLGGRSPAVGAADLNALRAERPRTGVAHPGQLMPEGELVLAEVQGAGEWKLVIPNLVVERAETEQDQFVRVFLVDERFFWGRGVLTRWAFNRRLKDGTDDRSSLHPGDGSLYTRSEVLAEVAQRLFRGHTVSHSPARWAEDRRETIFEAWGQASMALNRMVVEGLVEEPALRLDSSIAVHEFGDGKLGWAPDGQGPNSRDFPPGELKDAEGRGIVRALEQGHPEEFLIVVGLPTVATVAVDDWEPILLIGGRPYLLTEGLVRYLTEGRFGLDWLQRFVMLDEAQQSHSDLAPDVVAVLARGYTLWRLPGAEKVEAQTDEEFVGRTPADPRPAGGQDLPLDGSDTVGSPAFPSGGSSGPQISGPQYTGEPGPNAHLLPLLDRAETEGGRREPVTVETYTWKVVHKRFRSGKSPGLLAAFTKREEALTLMRKVAVAIGRPLGAGGLPAPGWFGQIERPLVSDIAGVATNLIGYRQDLEGMLRLARYAKATDNVLGGNVGSNYLAAEREIFELQEPKKAVLLDLAKKLAEIEGQAEKVRPTLRQGSLALINVIHEVFGEQIESLAAAARAEIERIDREQSRRGALGLVDPKTVEISRSLENLPRLADQGARVYSAELGIVETSRLAGHAAHTAVWEPSHTWHVPCPVRVLFGAYLRPRVDVRPGATTSVAVTAPRVTADLPTELPSASPADVSPKPAGRVAAAAAPGRGGGAKVREVRDSGGALVQLQSTVEGKLPPGANARPKAPSGGHVCPGGDNKVPTVLSDRESYYGAAFRRVSRGKAERVDVNAIDYGRTLRVGMPWTQLVPLSGPGNVAELDRDAQALASDVFDRPDRVKSASYTLGRLYPVQCDGVVSAVEIRSEQADGAICGFTMLVETGSDARAQPSSGVTRERPRRGTALP